VAAWTCKGNLTYRAASMKGVTGYGGVLGWGGVVGIEPVAAKT